MGKWNEYSGENGDKPNIHQLRETQTYAHLISCY